MRSLAYSHRNPLRFRSWIRWLRYDVFLINSFFLHSISFISVTNYMAAFKKDQFSTRRLARNTLNILYVADYFYSFNPFISYTLFLLLCLINSFFGTFEKTQLQIEHFLEHLAKWHCFFWYFLFIPAIYRCILAHLPIFFNQLSKFLRCESPSTFLGTCLSHHSFIIFLVTNTNTLLSGLYLISTKIEYNGNVFVANLCQCPLGLIPHFYKVIGLSEKDINMCQCPLGLIPHFYSR